MSEYIKREDVKRVINNNVELYGSLPWYEILDLIFEMPSADVAEVVRCKDCKYYDGERADGCYGGCFIGDYRTEADGFCQSGEREYDE